MPERQFIARGNFEEHNKQVTKEKEEREAEVEKLQRDGCECDYWRLKAQNLKNLSKIYTHAPFCPKSKK